MSSDLDKLIIRLRMDLVANMLEDQSKLLSCIKDLVDIVKNYHEGECCDHDAGICYCGEYSVLDEAERLLIKYEGGQNDD